MCACVCVSVSVAVGFRWHAKNCFEAGDLVADSQLLALLKLAVVSCAVCAALCRAVLCL